MKKITISIILLLLTSCYSSNNLSSNLFETLKNTTRENFIYESYEDSTNPYGSTVSYNDLYVNNYLAKFDAEKTNPNYPIFENCSYSSEGLFLDTMYSNLLSFLEEVIVEEIDKPSNIPSPTSRLTINADKKLFVYFYTTNLFAEIRNEKGESEYYSLSNEQSEYIYKYIDSFYGERHWVRPCTLLLQD